MGRPFFDPEVLRRLAGDKSYARGEAYVAHGHICLLSAGADGILAIAYGTRDYTVWIKRQAQPIEGQCNCPAYDDSGFCKHLVATALATNHALADGEQPDDTIGQVANHISKLDKGQLTRLVLDLTRSDWRALRALHFELGLDWGQDLD